MLKLKKNERCPIHRQYWCCGRDREQFARRSKHQSIRGVTRVDDPHHPRGYREKRNTPALREVTLAKLKEQGGICALCLKPIEDVREATGDHIEIRGLGGAWRDDHPSNIQAAHALCNQERGSMSMEAWWAKHPREVPA